MLMNFSIQPHTLTTGLNEHKEEIWKSIEGKETHVSDMDNNYLINVKKYVEKKCMDVILRERDSKYRKSLLDDYKSFIMEMFPIYEPLLKEIKKRKINLILKD